MGRVRRENSPPDRFLTLLTAPEQHSRCSDAEGQAHHRPLTGRACFACPRGAITSSTSRPDSLATGLHRERAKPEVPFRRCAHCLPGNRRATSPMSGRARYESGQKAIRGFVFPAIGIYLARAIFRHWSEDNGGKWLAR